MTSGLAMSGGTVANAARFRVALLVLCGIAQVLSGIAQAAPAAPGEAAGHFLPEVNYPSRDPATAPTVRSPADAPDGTATDGTVPEGTTAGNARDQYFYGGAGGLYPYGADRYRSGRLRRERFRNGLPPAGYLRDNFSQYGQFQDGEPMSVRGGLARGQGSRGVPSDGFGGANGVFPRTAGGAARHVVGLPNVGRGAIVPRPPMAGGTVARR